MLSDKKLQRIEKAVGKQVMEELDSLDASLLKDKVVNAEQSIQSALLELDNNPKYQELKESLKALAAGLSEVKKYQNAIIHYSLSLLEDKCQQQS